MGFEFYFFEMRKPRGWARFYIVLSLLVFNGSKSLSLLLEQWFYFKMPLAKLSFTPPDQSLVR